MHDTFLRKNQIQNQNYYISLFYQNDHLFYFILIFLFENAKFNKINRITRAKECK